MFPLVPLRRWADCLDGRLVPLNATERAEIPGEVPYWGANGVVDFVAGALFNEVLVLLGEDGAPFFDKSKEVAFVTRGPVWPNNHIHVLKPRSDVNPRFLAYALNAYDYAAVISGSTRDKLTQFDMSGMLLPAPSLEKPRAIADFLDAETARIDGLSSRYSTLSTLVAEREKTLVAVILSKKPFVKLKRIASLLPRFTFSSEDFSHDVANERLLRGVNVAPRSIDLGDCVRLREPATSDLKRYELLEGDLVVGMDRPFISTGTRVAKVSAEAEGALLVQRVCRLRFLSEEQSELAFAALAGPRFVEHIERSLTGVSVPHLSEDQIGDFEVPRLPLSDASRVVATIRRISDDTGQLVARCDEARARLAERKQALITAAVTGQLDLARTIAEEAS